VATFPPGLQKENITEHVYTIMIMFNANLNLSGGGGGLKILQLGLCKYSA